MSLRINSNIASLTTQRYLAKNHRDSVNAFKALSSGSRLSTPQNDAAGFAISELLRAQVAGTKQAKKNTESAAALVQTAEGALNEQNNILVRLRELAVSSASDTIGNREREFVDTEFQQLVAEFDRIAKSTRFGSKELLVGTGEDFSFHVGPNRGSENIIEFSLDADTQSDAVGIDGLSVDRKNSARRALEDIDKAVVQVASVRSTLGAVQSRFQFANDNLSVQHENLESSRSLIADADVAEEVSNLARAQVLEQAGMSVLTQANAYTSNLLRLIG